MLNNHRKNNKINERFQRKIYTDKKSTFTEILEKEDSFVSIHKRSLRLFVNMFKFKRDLAPAKTKENDSAK